MRHAPPGARRGQLESDSAARDAVTADVRRMGDLTWTVADPFARCSVSTDRSISAHQHA